MNLSPLDKLLAFRVVETTTRCRCGHRRRCNLWASGARDRNAEVLREVALKRTRNLKYLRNLDGNGISTKSTKSEISKLNLGLLIWIGNGIWEVELLCGLVGALEHLLFIQSRIS